MAEELRAGLSGKIIAKAKEFGADLAGVARVADLKASPSHILGVKVAASGGVGVKVVEGRKPGVVLWPETAKSAIVIAVSHPPEAPELDWWVLGGASGAGNTIGNRILMDINDALAAWLEKETGAQCMKLPYHVEVGGIFLKDAAVLAGLGCIGKNNMLVAPEFGPRLRLRALLVDMDLESTGPVAFDPCGACPMPCRSACPQKAFDSTIYAKDDYGLSQLPGRSGDYSRPLCNVQMETDIANQQTVAVEGQDVPEVRTLYCRECELACPVGA